MTDPRLEDHVVGLELQLVELVEQRNRADVQGRLEDVAKLDKDIAQVQQELVATAEVISTEEPVDEEPHVLAPTVDEMLTVPAHAAH
jgi:hypothetical protein